MEEAMEEITDEEWRRRLSPEQYEVLREKGTERPFTGRYVHTKDDGVYRCAACGNELFRSDTKFESGTGWPSFTEPADRANVELHEDRSHGMVRTEVTCKRCGSHLGTCSPMDPARPATATASTRSRSSSSRPRLKPAELRRFSRAAPRRAGP
jgi:peptide-methionine (R)-S-oxide reductase